MLRNLSWERTMVAHSPYGDDRRGFDWLSKIINMSMLPQKIAGRTSWVRFFCQPFRSKTGNNTTFLCAFATGNMFFLRLQPLTCFPALDFPRVVPLTRLDFPSSLSTDRVFCFLLWPIHQCDFTCVFCDWSDVVTLVLSSYGERLVIFSISRLTWKALIKLVFVSPWRRNSVLSSPNVDKMILWTTDNILTVMAAKNMT